MLLFIGLILQIRVITTDDKKVPHPMDDRNSRDSTCGMLTSNRPYPRSSRNLPYCRNKTQIYLDAMSCRVEKFKPDTPPEVDLKYVSLCHVSREILVRGIYPRKNGRRSYRTRSLLSIERPTSMFLPLNLASAQSWYLFYLLLLFTTTARTIFYFHRILFS